jgi:hypothetical protein
VPTASDLPGALVGVGSVTTSAVADQVGERWRVTLAPFAIHAYGPVASRPPAARAAAMFVVALVAAPAASVIVQSAP